MASTLAAVAVSAVALLPGWTTGDPRPALRAFRVSCSAPARPVRAALAPPAALAAACAEARRLGPAPSIAQTRTFFETRFEARRVPGEAFFTGYYEPVVEASLTRTDAFATPLYAPPAHVDQMPDRAAIMAGALKQRPLAYVAEPVEAFFIQVQGSARLRLRDGRLRRLAFAGRNGYPYTSIGKLLVERLHVPPADMGMTQLKAWIRANGQGLDEAGGKLMAENRSYIFFRFDDSLAPNAGPIGGAGVSLTPRVSLAVDKTRWPYGLPFYVDATVPAEGASPEPLQKLMVAQDTGSAIVGDARADVFLGSGPEAEAQAGAMRERGTLYVLWPKPEKGR